MRDAVDWSDIEKEEYADWKVNYITKALIREIKQIIEDETYAIRSSNDHNEFLMRNGRIEGIERALDLLQKGD